MDAVQKIITGKKLTVHLWFCTAVLALLLAGTWALQAQGFIFGDIGIILARSFFFLACIYTGRWLCRHWYLQNRLALFLLYTLLCSMAAVIGWWLVVRYVFGNRYAGFFEVLLSALPFFVIGLVLGIFIKLTRVTIQKQVQDARIVAEQKQTELSLLQSQLSPHFLFNTLNNMYSISIVQHELVPGLLLKLSDLLRYAVYTGKQSFLPLKEELAYIHNYIGFEKIRIGDRLSLQMDMEAITDPGITVPPMVLIVFIENAFKHAKNTFDQKIYIDISLKMQDGFILFSVKNSYSSFSDENKRLTENSGIGLANTIKRLDLLYGGDYTLKRFAENELYVVQLRLKIK